MRRRSWCESTEMSNCFPVAATVAVARHWRVKLNTRWQVFSWYHLIGGWNVLILTFIVLIAMHWETFSFLLSILGASVFKPNLKSETCASWKKQTHTHTHENKNEEGAMFIPRHQKEFMSRISRCIPAKPLRPQLPTPALFLLASPSPCPIGERAYRKISLFSCSPRPTRSPLGFSLGESQGCTKQKDR